MRNLMLAGVAALALGVALPAFAAGPTQGGSITVTFKDDVTTLDPAIGYDWQNWSMIKSLFSTLMGYKPGTTDLEPELATSYDVSEDGKTYTFHLRDDVKFTNGRKMVASDVAYSIDRTVNPKTQSPGAGFFSSIVGYDAVAAGKADTLSGIETPDDHTVVFHLSRPDATFLQVVALNFASVVPKEIAETEGQDFGTKPVGTGAFKLKEWVRGQRIVFERNPDYFMKGLPHLDRIVFEVGQEPTVAMLRLQRGEVDIAGDGIPPAQFLQTMNDPKWKENIVIGQQLETSYVTMNVKMKPFDDVRVRKAVNMAINKDRIVRIVNGRAVPAGQVLPPLMPGYDKDYKGYPYDPKAAKKLLAEAGYPDGFETQLFVANTDPQPRIAQAIQQDLAQVGIKASIQSLAQANVIAAGGEPDQAPMVWSGGMAWIDDFPDPSDFYGPILGCAGATKGGWNWSWYCDKEMDRRATAADSLSAPKDAEKRVAMWRGIFTDIMKNDAPWAPVFNEKRYTIKSDRLGGGKDLFIDPIHLPVNYDNIWVKQ